MNKKIVFISPTHDIYGGGQVYINELSLNIFCMDKNINVDVFSSDDLMTNVTKKISRIDTWPRLIKNILNIVMGIDDKKNTVVVLNDINLSMFAIIFKMYGIKVISLLHMDLQNSTISGFGKKVLIFLRKYSILLGADSVFHVNIKNMDFLNAHDKYFLGNFYSPPKAGLNIDKCNEKHFDFVFVGRMSEEKDPISFVHLIKGFVESYNVNIRAAIVGGGALLESVKNEIIKCNLSDCITIFGEQPRSDVVQIIKKSKTLIITSKTEGFPTVILEAASVSVPSICPRLGSVPYIFNKYNIGSLCEVVDMLPYMKDMLDCENKSYEFDALLSDYSIDNVTLKFLSLVNEL